MIAYVQVDPRGTPDPGVRQMLIEGQYDGVDFTVKLVNTEVLGHRRPPKIVFHRDGFDDVQVTMEALLRSVFIGQDECDPNEATWQPMTPADTIVDVGARRELEDDEEVWSNDLYTAIVARQESPGGHELVHISYHRHDKAAVRDWRHGQNIKNDIVGPDAEGIELYPADGRMVDLANQYHIWCIHGRWPVGFDEGRQVLSAASTEAMMIGGLDDQAP